MRKKLKWDSLTIAAGAVAAIGTLLTPVLDPYGIDHFTTAVNAGLPLAFWAASVAGAMFVAFVLPRLRVGSLAGAWRVPSSTYLFPRWVVRMSLGAIVGGFVATLILGAVHDARFFWFAALIALIGVAFYAGGWQRLKKSADTEFTVPWRAKRY